MFTRCFRSQRIMVPRLPAALAIVIGTSALAGSPTSEKPPTAGDASPAAGTVAPPAAQAEPIEPSPEPLQGPVALDLLDLFVHPIGPEGMEFSEKTRSLDGKRVVVEGYMVRQELPYGKRFLLTTRPVILEEDEMGPGDDLPPQTIFCFLPDNLAMTVVYTPARLRLTGTLRLGHREEPDNMVSFVRLLLEPPEKPSPDSTPDAAPADAPAPPGQP